MWAEALDLLDQAERMHRALFRPGPARARTACWEPPVDMFESDDELWIQIALPGVQGEHVELGFNGDALVIAGQRPLPLPRRPGTIHRLEMPHGRFERRIGLPPGRYELARRDLADGCLTLSLRKLG
jgi:HSP20 family molecular chaperone IbpA